MSVVRVKDGVLFKLGTPASFRLVSAIEVACRTLDYGDFTITSGADGEHSGPLDPHHEGNAYDIRSHDFPEAQKPVVLNALMAILGTEKFYGFLEVPGTSDEHFHVQLRHGVTYP